MTKFFFLLFLAPIFLQAQQTGSFQETVTFTEPDYNFTRTLYYYVPTDYDPTQSYKLMVGFRGGTHTNAGQFRDQLAFFADAYNAIVFCPENIDDLPQEGLVKQLFQYSVEHIQGIYNIDSDFIYLVGHSFGGRHSVIVSMDTDNGPIPNLRGAIPFAPGLSTENVPNYNAIDDFPPACICIGLNDSSGFIEIANTLNNDIQANGGISFLNEIEGVGHTVNFPTFSSEIIECIDFIESQILSINKPLVSYKGIHVVPNPASSTITLSYSDLLSPTKIYVLDGLGRTMLNLNPNSKLINISNLLDGVYFLVVVMDKTIEVKTFIKAH